MHVLIIPSEEFVPEYCPVAGIFQYHQASILRQKKYKVGVISIKLSFSVQMIVKALAFKLLGKKAGNAADNQTFFGLMKLGWNKVFNPSKFLQIENREGIEIYRIDGFFYTKPIDNKNDFGWIKAGLAAFEKYIKTKGKPHLIHAHNAVYAGMLAQKIKEKFKIPYIITEHSTVFKRNLITDKGVLAKVAGAYNNSESLYAVSQSFADLLNSMFNIDRFQCLPNVLDPFLENQEFKMDNRKSNEFVFLNIAELHPKKDHFTLIKAFKRINEKYKNAKLWIGGDGQLLHDLKAFVSTEELNDKVNFLGSLNRKEVFERIMQSDCFVLSSKYETFGVVVIEAMLFGKPVIVTKCGGPESFVTNNLGLVVEPDNVLHLADAMEEMIKNYSVYKPDQIRSFTIKEYGKERFFERIQSAYKISNQKLQVN